MTRLGAVVASAKLMLAIGAGLALAVGLCAPTATAHGAAYESKVTMKDPYFPGSMWKRGTLRYGGRVRSDAHACEKGREVVLYRKVSGTPAAELQATEADNDGKWYIDWDVNSPGKYYARVARVTVNGKTCLADKSDVFLDETR